MNYNGIPNKDLRYIPSLRDIGVSGFLGGARVSGFRKLGFKGV